MNEKPAELARVIPAISIETQAIISRLRDAKVNEVVTYVELSSLVKRNVQKHRGSLDTARRRLLSDDRRIFGVVLGVGLRLLAAPEAAESISADVTRVRRGARRGLRKAQAIDVLKVPQTARAALVARASLLGLIDQASAPASLRKLAAVVESQPKPENYLPMQAAIAALKDM